MRSSACPGWPSSRLSASTPATFVAPAPSTSTTGLRPSLRGGEGKGRELGEGLKTPEGAWEPGALEGAPPPAPTLLCLPSQVCGVPEGSQEQPSGALAQRRAGLQLPRWLPHGARPLPGEWKATVSPLTRKGRRPGVPKGKGWGGGRTGLGGVPKCALSLSLGSLVCTIGLTIRTSQGFCLNVECPAQGPKTSTRLALGT